MLVLVLVLVLLLLLLLFVDCDTNNRENRNLQQHTPLGQSSLHCIESRIDKVIAVENVEDIQKT